MFKQKTDEKLSMAYKYDTCVTQLNCRVSSHLKEKDTFHSTRTVNVFG